jgi:hypothetical protein
MSAATVPCTYCGKRLDSEGFGTHQRVVGWERVVSMRASGNVRGRSDIALRERSQHWACDPCIRRLQRGLSPTQGDLMEGLSDAGR